MEGKKGLKDRVLKLGAKAQGASPFRAVETYFYAQEVPDQTGLQDLQDSDPIRAIRVIRS
jgi:hypothetical protein